jgi:hypothetical protein
MYNNDVGERFIKQKGTLTSATLYFTSYASGSIFSQIFFISGDMERRKNEDNDGFEMEICHKNSQFYQSYIL